MSAHLYKRVKELKAWIFAMEYIHSRIRLELAHIPTMLKELLDNETYGKSLAAIHEFWAKYRDGGDVPSILVESIDSGAGKSYMDQHDVEIIKSFARGLKNIDLDGQLNNCTKHIESLKCRLKLAEEDTAKKGKLYSSMGILVGLFMVVIFI